MALRRSGVRGDLVGLARAAHFAGQAFGYEEMVALPSQRLVVVPSSRLFWRLIAVAALVGLAVFALAGSFSSAWH